MASRVQTGEHAVSYAHLPKLVGKTDPVTRIGRLVLPFVFGRDVQPGDKVSESEYATMFAYKAMLDMHVESQQALMILKFFSHEIASAWSGDKSRPLILSLSDGRYAVMITTPECRRLYDYVDDIDRTHPSQAIPLPVPVVQASVNLARVIELDLQIR
jgi:hypothetical protein